MVGLKGEFQSFVPETSIESESKCKLWRQTGKVLNLDSHSPAMEHWGNHFIFSGFSLSLIYRAPKHP